MKSKPVDLQNIKDWVRWAASKFNHADLFLGHGTDDVFVEARTLVLHALDLPIDTPDFYLDTRLLKKEARRVKSLIKKRIKTKMPVAYLTNKAWFAGLEFFVDERVLVPRSPIAELIDNHFSPWLDYNQTHNILDLCTGSACIACALSYAFENAQVDAVDLSTLALEVAKINVERHGLGAKVSLYQGDLFEPLGHKKYDLIVSNPPYVDALDMSNLPTEIQYEPKIGLVAGEDGLELVDKIIQVAKQYLNPNGILIVEVGNSQEALISKYPNLEFTWLDFKYGGNGVFLLNFEQLVES